MFTHRIHVKTLTGVRTALSTRTGKPRVLPRSIVTQRISLLRCLRLPLILVSTVGLPMENPTFAYADVTSNSIANISMEPAGSAPVIPILLRSTMQT